MIKRVSRSLAFATTWSIWVLLCIEIGLQLYYYANAHQSLLTRNARPIFAPNKYCKFFNKANLSYVHKTNEFKIHLYTNSKGFRVPRPGIEYSKEKAPDTFRILLLGPSFAYGWGVNYEDTVAARLDKMLGSCLPAKSKIEIINAGVPSLGPLPQLNWLIHVGVLYKPDLIIQFIYGSMAVYPDDPNLFVDREGYLEHSGLSTSEWLFREAKKSAIVFYGWMLYTDLFPSSNGEVLGAGRKLERAPEFNPDAPDEKTSMVYYSRLERTAQENGARLSIVYFPLSYCIHRGDLIRWRHLGADPDIDGQIAFDRSFCGYLNREGVDCLNVTPDLVKAAAESPKRLYYWLDIHWTPRGNLVVARRLARHVAIKFMDGCKGGSPESLERNGVGVN
jgi:SGNH hydrolase-like domain, acetyltransferase AlgX